MTTTRLNIGFYQHLGKLCYAIAAVDKHIHPNEIKQLHELVASLWLDFDDTFDVHNEDSAYQLEIVFDWLLEQSALSSNEAYNDFINYCSEHPYFFNPEVKQLILKTTNAIAQAFARKNKSELIFLARLESDLKKVNTKSK